MTFTSLSDLYFITLGLYVYNVLFDVLFHSGIILVPLIAMVAGAIKSGLERGVQKAQLVNQVIYKLIAMILVYVLVINPFRPLHVEGMEVFNRSCDTESISEDINKKIDYATIRRAMEEPEEGEEEVEENRLSEMAVRLSDRDIRITVLIEFALRIGTSISLHSVKAMPCSVDLIAVSGKLLSDNIRDKRLLAETRQFVKQCHAKAKNWAVTANDKSFPWLEKADKAKSTVTDWPGYSGYMNDNYYGNQRLGMNTSIILEGYDDYYNPQGKDAKKKRPTCREWWQGKGSGIEGSVVSVSSTETSLKQRLLNEIDPQSKAIMYAIKTSILNGQPMDDQVLQGYYFNTYRFSEIMSAEVKDYGDSAEGFWGTVADSVYRGIATVGMTLDTFTSNPTASIIQIAAPLAKSALLMMIIAMLPFVFVVGLNAQYITGITVLLISIMMWPIYWELTMLAQQSFVEEAMGGGALEATLSPNIILVSKKLTDAAFVLAPSILTTLLTSAGMAGGQAFSNTVSSSSASGAASGASKGAGAVSKGANTAKKMATKGKG